MPSDRALEPQGPDGIGQFNVFTVAIGDLATCQRLHHHRLQHRRFLPAKRLFIFQIIGGATIVRAWTMPDAGV